MAFIQPKFKLKRENFRPRHCLTKCDLENKLLNQNCWSWYHFLRRSYLINIHWYQLLHPHYCGKYAVPFFSGSPCTRKLVVSMKTLRASVPSGIASLSMIINCFQIKRYTFIIIPFYSFRSLKPCSRLRVYTRRSPHCKKLLKVVWNMN